MWIDSGSPGISSAHKKIAVTVPRGQNDDGDHGNMTGVDVELVESQSRM